MAGLFCDSFDHYVSADVTEKWTTSISTPTIQAAAGRHSSSALRINTSGEGVRITLSPTDPSSFVYMFSATRQSATISTAGYIAIVAESDNRKHLGVGINLDGTLFVGRGGGTADPFTMSSATVLATSSTALQNGQTYWIEFKGVISDTVGSYTLRINTVEEASANGVDTQNGGTGQWSQFSLGSANCAFDFDDLVVLDQSGTINNDFLGDVRVDSLFTTAEGNTDDFTPSTGTDNSANVDDATPDDDSTYNTATATETDTHVTQNAPVVGAYPRMVQVVISAKKTDSGTCTMAPVIRIGSDDHVGDDAGPGTTYGYSRFVYDASPATDVAFTEAEFNAAEFGYKRTA